MDGGKSALALAEELKISLPTMYNTLKRAGWSGREGQKAKATSSKRNGTPAKRGRPFRFSDEQAAGFRKRVESGESATVIAKEVKVSLPALYNTLKRAGWSGRGGRPAKVVRSKRNGTAAKRGRPFKFSGEQAASFRKRIESGETATAIAKEVKVSLPALYNTLKRAGWSGRKRRKAKAA